MMNADEKKESLQRQYNSAKSSAAIWHDSRGWSSYAQEEYRQAKEKMDDSAKQLKELEEEVNTKMDEIRNRADAVVEHQFCGWNIYHRFRCANGLGIQQISDILIVVDENMEQVKGRFMLDDDYSLYKLKKAIDKAIEPDLHRDVQRDGLFLPRHTLFPLITSTANTANRGCYPASFG